MYYPYLKQTKSGVFQMKKKNQRKKKYNDYVTSGVKVDVDSHRHNVV